MIGILNPAQIQQVLRSQMYGRLGCVFNNKVYVVPVSYAFDGKYLYAHSREGHKIDILRKNPNVCFQVDVIDNLSNWRSAIVWGQYNELKTAKDQTRAMSLLDDRFGPLHVSQSISRASAGVHPPESVEKKKKAVYFRISMDEATGRFEKSN